MSYRPVPGGLFTPLAEKGSKGVGSMSDKKKKVKDLATELGVQPKDILAAAKDLGIVGAKAATSSLTESEAGKLREQLAAPAPADKPEVIVRSKKASNEPAAAAEPTPEAPVAAPAKEPAPVAATEQAEEAPAPKAAAAKAQKAQKPAPARVVPAPETAARIVRPAGAAEPAKVVAPAQAPAAQAPTPPQAETTAAVVTPAKEEAAPKQPQAEAAQQPAVAAQATAPAAKAEPAQAKPQAEGAPAEARKPQPAQEAADPARGNARIIRPASFSAEPERNAQGQRVSSAPAMPTRVEGAEGATAEHASDDASSSKVRVISRPAPVPPGTRPPQAPRRDGGHPGGHNGPGGQRPGGHPGGPGREGNRDNAGRPPREGGYAPGGSAPGGQRPGGPGGPGGQRHGGPGGPGGQRPGGPGGQRPMGARPAPGGGAPAPFAPASPDSEQGRKKRNKGRRTVEFGAESHNDDDMVMKSSGRRKGRGKQREVQPSNTAPMKAGKRVVKVEEFIRVADLAHQMGMKSGEIIKVLFGLGIMATINKSLDIDTATLVAAEFGYEVEKVGFFEEDYLAQHREEDVEEQMTTRPPVVTIMGHVDHGKTSLLDALRKSTVASGEAGGITQHIGAYHVRTPKGEIVFLDTPGHEAFTAMRARGAEVTDIVVLVVAADDGVMEQTREAISHAKAAGVPIMVAVNKMDKPEANPERVKRELAEQGLVAEDWGGDVTFSYVSAKTREGLDELLELLALQAEILELKANAEKHALGHIVEAKLDKGRGALGTVLIRSGTLRQGDAFVCGIHSGRVRAMFNDQGKKVKEAGPSMPVEVQGFEGVPEAGDEFFCLADDKMARRIAETRALKQRERDLAKESKVTLETFLAKKADDVEAVVLNLVIKSDVQGSLEAITDAMNKLTTEKVRIHVIHGGTGAISESDVLLASASGAIIIGFNVRPTVKAKELAENEKVDMRFYDIIYKLVEEIKSAMEGMLAPVSREIALGTVDIRETFSVPKVGTIAGCYVTSGKVLRSALVRLLRDGVVIYSGKITSLRRFKEDAREVNKGYECGIGLENYNDLKVGDVIEAYEIIEEAAKL